MQIYTFKILLQQLCEYLSTIDDKGENLLFQNNNSEYYIFCKNEFVAKCVYYILDIIYTQTDLKYVMAELSEAIDFYISVYEYLPIGINLHNISISDLANIIYTNSNINCSTTFIANNEYYFTVLNMEKLYELLNTYLSNFKDESSEIYNIDFRKCNLIEN